ncbi:hypothetical protein AHMF7616_02138 [Adhaeribacter pallidiroseus]|uniref:Uncharacterized protein n=2 Tax=Adhaeribacter pallidiroseus TaxID=2072847 RepID=A0A369QF49_9BACT|nr:hypothetical protein AHMF7616_02138 [Adhaeribacter pallidiroseus]
MVAWYFGPAGLVQLAHFQNLVTFITLVPNDGINRGVIKYLAGTTKQSQTFRAYFTAGFYLTLTLFLGTAVLLFSARNYFLPYFPRQLSWFSLFIGGTLLLVLQSFFNAVLLAQHKNGTLILVNTFSALAVIVYVAFAIAKLPVAYFLIGYLLVMGSMGIIALPLSLQGLPKKQLFTFRVSGESVKSLSKYMVMATSVVLFSKGLEYYIRDYLIRHFSMEQTGLWQGVVRVSDSYTALYTAVLAFAFYPKVAALLQQEQALQLFVQNALRLLIPVIMLGLGLVYIFQDYIFTLLLSSRFQAAKEFLPFQLAGDFCKLLSWLFANILVAQARFKVSILFEAISALFYFGFFHFFTNIYQLAGSPMAHFAHYLVFLLLHLFYFRKLITA